MNNPELLIGLTKNKIIQILSNSELPLGTLALLMESLTREMQVAANNAFEQAYAAAQEEEKQKHDKEE